VKKRFLLLLVAVVLGLFVTPVWADTLLYDNGPINGTINGFAIYGGTKVGNSFTLSAASNLTEAQIGLWLYPGQIPVQVDWEIGTGFADNTYGSGTSVFSTNTGKGQSGGGYAGYDLYESTFALNLLSSLGAGTYWLTLTNATSTDSGYGVWWDINDGPSAAWTDAMARQSESFQIYGTPSGTTAAPEPATMLLLGLGLVGLAGARRKFKK
jgi:hypothetical protein